MLALEIEYLTGNVVASSGPDDPQLDWPPQPDRVFSALVASWGARGEVAAERLALEWLEQQNPPRILSDDASPRTVATVFVPPNDFKTSANGRFDVLPSRRQRQARHFPAGRPSDALVKLVWPDTPEPAVRNALDALARDTSYVGHSSSLTRCRFIEGDYDLSASHAPKRTVYKGRLAELERLFHAGRRPSPGEIVVAAPRAAAPQARSIFSEDWMVLADDGGRAPDLLAAPLVARTLRDALMGAYQRAFGASPPEWLSGHRADGFPSQSPHAAFVPMADIGWKGYSSGRFMGLGIVLPRGTNPEPLYEAIRALIDQSEDDRRMIELHFDTKGPWMLSPVGVAATKASLLPSRWLSVRRSSGAHLWATATPIVLDRYPKKRNGSERAREIGEQIANACTNIGLPRPSLVSANAVSTVSGSPPAVTVPDAQAWQRWQLPRSLRGRYLTHAVVGFDEPVRGPLIIGAGRYAGLGLCMPLDPETAS